MEKQELAYYYPHKEIRYLVIRFENEQNHRIQTLGIEISNLLKGKAPLRVYILNLGIVALLFGISLVIPVLFFPTSYSMKTNFISDLGVYFNNPRGAPIFNTGMIISGFLQIPLMMKMFHVLENGDLILAQLTRILGLIGALGFILVGIFPSNISTPHLTGAFMVFIGYFLVANIEWLIFIRRRKRMEEFQRKMSYLHILYIVFNLIAFQFFIATGIEMFYPNHILHSYGIFSSSLWEWIFFIAICACQFLFFFNISKLRINKNIRSNSAFESYQKQLAPVM